MSRASSRFTDQALNNPSRRRFLKDSVTSAAVLTVGFALPVNMARAETELPKGAVSPNAWLTINADNTFTIFSSAAEMGQGVFTSLPMMIAEELEVLPEQMNIEHAPVGDAFKNQYFGFQATGGSTSVRWAFDPLRQIGADTRELLKNAAARHWHSEASELTAKEGFIHHPDGRSLSYASLGKTAEDMPMPTGSKLKPRSEWTLLGTEFKRKDTAAKVLGTAQFGIDVQVDGMLTATVKACPTFGGTLASVDAAPAMAIKGVKQVVKLDSAVAVCATDYWSAKKGLDVLKPVWDLGSGAGLSSADIREKMLLALDEPGIEGLNAGNMAEVKEASASVHSALYEAPYLAHATMEPMNATVDASGEQVKVWAPIQSLARAQLSVAKALNVAPEKVTVEGTFMGGGFGRRGGADYVVQAALISEQVKAPVKLIWSREEDMTQGPTRPMTLVRFEAALDDSGQARGFSARSACQSIIRTRNPKAEKDKTITEGIIDTDYRFDASFMDYHMADVSVPVTFWRSVGYSQNSWMIESFVDELAAIEGVDPYKWRRQRLTNQQKINVLDLAAEKAGWGSPQKGFGQGIAVVHSFDSTVVHVLEASVDDQGEIVISKITSAVDCGLAINPASIRAQIESSIVYGLTAAMYGELSIEKGAIQQANFHQYDMMRLRHMPSVDVHIIESTGKPGGIGEPGLPPIAPALCNAIYAVTGKRVRKLPLSSQGFRFS